MDRELISNPGRHDHFVLLYQEVDALASAVSDYLTAGLRRGEAGVIIATPEHRAAFLERIKMPQAVSSGQIKVLDAEEVLAKFMANGMPQWKPFHEVIGGLIAELRL